jgi:hypothetical protein
VISRRTFVSRLGFGVILSPFAGKAQHAGKPRIGYLSNSPDITNVDAAFLDRLHDRGYRDDTTRIARVPRSR